MITLSTELDYSSFDSSLKDAAGHELDTRSTDFDQRYFVNMNLAPFPTVRINGGVIVGKDVNDTSTPTGDLHSSITTVQPSISLELADPFRIYSAGIGFTRRETTTGSPNSPATTLINDTTYATFGWRPLEFPSINLLINRMDQYDQNRSFQDTLTNTAILSSRYAPLPSIKLNYTADYTDTQDKMSGLDVQTLSHTAGVSYTGLFWDKRVLLTTGYTGNFSKTDTSEQGTGTVDFQLFPLAGLSGVSDTPLLDTLTANAALIDGNLTVSAGVNIGSSLSLAGDTKPRETGVDFVVMTAVNSAQVWVNEQLTPEIAGSYSWNIYTSTDGKNWKFLQTVSPAPFGPFLNRFTITFQSTVTRYLKVATRPLPVTVQGATAPNFQNIFITELQVFQNLPAGSVRGGSSEASQSYNLSVRTQLLNGATSLSHDFSFNALNSNASGRPSETYYMFTTGLNALHRFNTVWTGSGRVAWEETSNSGGSRSDLYSWNGVLSASPLKTLRASMVYSGQISVNNKETITGNGLGMNATADLYPGISLNVTGAANDSHHSGGETTESLATSASLGLTPNKRMTFNLSYGSSRLRSSGGNLTLPTTGSSTQIQASTTVRPTDTVYATASVMRQSQSAAPSYTIQNYSLNWSPFSGGTLQFYFLYNENLRSDTSTVTKTVGPGVTWKVIPRASLDFSYAEITTLSPVETQEIKSLNAVFKLSL